MSVRQPTAPSRDADAAWEALRDAFLRDYGPGGSALALLNKHRPLIEAAIQAQFQTVVDYLAIRAAAPRPEPLDVERLARAMEDVFPGWLDEAPGTAEAQIEMRDYARQLGEAYEFLRDSASPGAALAPSEPTDG